MESHGPQPSRPLPVPAPRSAGAVRLHPLLGLAAVAVIVASAAVVWAVMARDSLADPHAAGDAPVVAQSADRSASSTAPQSTPQHAAPQSKPAEAPPASDAGSTSAPALRADAHTCQDCGRVTSVNASVSKGQGTGVGAVAGGALGGLLGNQFGGGNGRIATTVIGAVGGGLAGNEVEKNARSAQSWTVHVRMDDGRVRSFPSSSQPRWNPGDRVRVVDGHLASVDGG